MSGDLISRAKTVAFQGEPGAYAHLAAREALPHAEAVPRPTFDDAVNAVRNGCIGEADSRDFKPDGVEITEARWLSRDDAKRLIAGDRMADISVPPAIAIAHHLIKAFAEGR